MKTNTLLTCLSALLAVSPTLGSTLPSAHKRDTCTCRPDFAGRAVSIVSSLGTVEWGIGTHAYNKPLTFESPSLANAEFDVSLSGDADSSYVIKSADSTEDLFVTRSPRGNIMLWNFGAERWDIECAYCSPGDSSTFHGTYAAGCVVKMVSNGFCSVAGQTGSYQSFSGCDGVDTELWDFVFA